MPRRNTSAVTSRARHGERVAPNNTQAVMKNCPVFAGRNNESFQEYKSKLRTYLRVSLQQGRMYSKRFKARSSHYLL